MADVATEQPSGSTTTGPTSFSDPSLTWSDAPSASTPAADTPAASTSAETIPPPAATSATDGLPQQQGTPPPERWPDILANARTKAAEEAIAPLAWARDVNPQEFQQIRQIARHFASGDVVAGIKSLYAEASKDPAVAAAFRSEAARQLAQRQQASSGLELVNVQLEDGSIVAMPRDPAAYLAAQKQQWMDELKQELSPVTKTIGELQAERQEAVRQQQIAQYTNSTYADAQTWPGMDSDENKKAVAEELARRTDIDPNDPREVTLALNAAWRKVVAPQLGKRAEAQLLDSLKTKAAASTSVNPSAASPSTPRRVDRFDQLPKEAW